MQAKVQEWVGRYGPAELAGIGFSFTVHGPAIFFEPREWALETKTARADFCVAISKFARAQTSIYCDPARWDDLHVVHCGVPDSAPAGPEPDLQLAVRADNASANAADAVKGARPAYFPEAGGFTDTPIYDRYRLAPSAHFAGPAIVEERESTVIVGPGAQCRIDAQWNLVIAL